MTETVIAQEMEDEIRIAKQRIVAVIPAYNESKTIGDVVKGALEHADEVFVIDDGSDDSTAHVAKAAGACVIQIPENNGKGMALSIGLSTAAMNGANIIVCLDADGQHDPAEIPKICVPILEGRADLVIGSRFLDGQGEKEIPRYRKLGQSVLTKATNFGNGTKITDSQSGFRCMTKKAALAMDLTERGMGIESEMIIDATNLGLKIEEVSINCKYDGLETSTFKPGRHGTSVIGSIIRVIRDEHPLLYFGVGGLVLTIVGVSTGLYSLYQFISYKSLPFLPSLVAILFFFLGIISIFSGIILNSLSISRK